MSEPFFIAQTFEPDVVGDAEAAQAWVQLRVEEAAAEGGTFARCTFSDAGDGLLFECWEGVPADQGEPRWQLQTSE